MALAQLQAERVQHLANLQDVDEILAMAPDEPEALALKTELMGHLAGVNEKIAALTGAAPSTSVSTSASASASPVARAPSETGQAQGGEKWKKEDHAAHRKHADATGQVEDTPKAPVVFKQNDTVLAKYQGDKQFYEARILSIMGSSTAPIYTVKFKGYDGTETVRANEIRPLFTSSTAQKRKADGDPVTSTPSTAPGLPTINAAGVISAAAKVDPELAAAAKAKNTKVLGAPEPKKPAKKSRTTKALEDSKNNWQAWQSKAASGKAKKVVTKESQFRTGESATAKVGFTGSGQGMRKDPTRSRHNYTLDG